MTTSNVELAGWPHAFKPARGDAPVLLMLHGTGSNEQDIASLGGTLDPEAGVLAPRGRVRENGSLRWFRRNFEGVFDVDDVIKRARELSGFIESASELYGIEDRRIIAVGFSNGANIALATAILHPEVLDRVVAFSGMYPLAERTSPVALAGSHILTVNGQADAMAPLPSVNKLITELTHKGATVAQVLRPGGHSIEPNDLEAAKKWLARNI